MWLKGQDTMQQLEAALRCPLCLRIMEDPVIVISSSGSPQLKPGVSYERSELEALLLREESQTVYVPNYNLKRLIPLLKNKLFHQASASEAASDATGEQDVLGLEGGAAGMLGTEIGVLKDPHHEGLSGLLQGHDG
jgi:hypothetical protein